MRFLEGLFIWGGIVVYIAAFLFVLAGLIFKKDRALKAGWVMALVAFSAHTLSIAARWYISGHPPFYGNYEHFLAQSWFFMCIFLAASMKNRRVRALGAGMLPFCVLLLGYGMMGGDTGPEPLPPPYRSLWLWVHAISWFGYGAFFIAAIVSVLYLLKVRGYIEKMPEAETLDIMSYRMMVFGFITLAIGTGAGALWAYGLWGRYWAWDPIEIWTLITWLVYGLNIHLRLSMGWRGEKAAKFAIVSLICPIITLGGIGFVGGVHTPLL